MARMGGDAPTAQHLNAIERRLRLRSTVLEAMKAARLYGGAAIYCHNALKEDHPLTGKIEALRLLAKGALTPSQTRDEDFASPTYGQPLYFELNRLRGRPLKIHPSRLAFFHGLESPKRDSKQWAWGDSVLMPCLDVIKALDAGLLNASALFHKAVIDVIKSPGLSEQLSRPDGQTQVQKRLETFKFGSSVHALAVLDGDETLERPAVTFAGQDKMIQEFAQGVAAAADIPMTRLFGRAPGGMNASGESDLRNYYDRVKALQELQIETALKGIDAALRHEAGVGEETRYTWRPLWQPTQDAVAQTALKTAKTATQLVDKGLWNPEEGKNFVNARFAEFGVGLGCDGSG